MDMWKSCTVNAVVAEGFALTGRCKVVRMSLLCRKSIVELCTRDWRATTIRVESPLLDATVASDSLSSQTSYSETRPASISA